MTRRRPSGVVLVGCMVGLLALTSCSDDSDPDDRSVELDAPRASAETSPSAEADEVPEDPPESGLVQGLDPASTPEEQAVTRTWFAYWTELTRMYTEVTVDRATFGSLAREGAYEGPVRYVERMQGSGTANTGGAIASVEKVVVEGSRAVVTGCQRTDLVERTEDGTPVEAPTPFVRTQETLQREGDTWIVVGHSVLSSMARCDYR